MVGTALLALALAFSAVDHDRPCETGQSGRSGAAAARTLASVPGAVVHLFTTPFLSSGAIATASPDRPQPGGPAGKRPGRDDRSNKERRGGGDGAPSGQQREGAAGGDSGAATARERDGQGDAGEIGGDGGSHRSSGSHSTNGSPPGDDAHATGRAGDEVDREADSSPDDQRRGRTRDPDADEPSHPDPESAGELIPGDHVVEIPLDPPATRVMLLEPDAMRPGLFRMAASASDTMRAAPGPVIVEGVPVRDDLLVNLELERFEVLAPGARVVLGARGRRIDFDPHSIALYRGRVAGVPFSNAYLAVSRRGVLGRIDFGPGRGRYVLGSRGTEGRGLACEELAVVEACGSGPPLADDACLMLDAPRRPQGGVARRGPVVTRLIEVAVDTDYEYYSLFAGEEAAAAYVVALFGAVSDLYMRELQARVVVTYIRLWNEPNDPYDQPNPLSSFVNEWNTNQRSVHRDTAHLLTGRRNLPYGGVAYVSSLCSNLGYAISGYLNGTFIDPDAPDPANWDLVVVAHELGHNCGALHTHDYQLDNCAGGEVRRAGVMSYCHTVSGGVSNVDMRFETPIREYIHDFFELSPCLGTDCDGNGIDDAEDIANGTWRDGNRDGIPDICQDCNGNGLLDPVDIARRRARDADGNGRPDSCDPDCNGNGIPDSIDIASGTSADIGLDGVPDECETDCNGNRVSDYVQILGNMMLDVDRNAELDACQDCDGNGLNDFAELNDGLHLWVGSLATPMRLFHPRSGAPVRSASGATVGVSDVRLAPDGAILALFVASGSVARVDPHAGALIGMLVPSGSAEIVSPGEMLLTTDGRLLVASIGTARVFEFDAETGALLGVLADFSLAGVGSPVGLVESPSGTIVVSTTGNRVLELDPDSGAILRTIVPQGSGGLLSPRGVLFLPDSTLLVASYGSGSLLRYDATTGRFLGRWDLGGPPGSAWGLARPWSLRLDATGERVLVSSNQGGTAIHAYDAETGHFLRTFYVFSSDIAAPTGFVVLPPSPLDCNRNAIVDACDILSGRSSDWNGNGIPDDCEGLQGGPADLNRNGDVDGADLGILLGAWGACDGCPEDLNKDGSVDGADIGLLLSAW